MREYEKRVSPTKKSARWEAIRFAAFIRDFSDLAVMPLSEVTAEQMGRWRDARLAGDAEKKRAPVGSATVLREINLYSHVFTIARDEWKWARESPFTSMRRPTEPQPGKRRISDDERDLILSQLGYRHDETPKTKSARIGLMFVFALKTAMRAAANATCICPKESKCKFYTNAIDMLQRTTSPSRLAASPRAPYQIQTWFAVALLPCAGAINASQVILPNQAAVAR
ncbi:hypothetical protein QS306_05475 [Paraburkholderia bonniea]|uniref:hypothetical protein n=1 Tax=Paraburkholderia bonniea TaxID=2152891 RepID=UPI001FE71E7A|nr:hypothetical protein [Paraburkholderia bonniea]WJF91094.1 hypothetical protein QS306_05475 [Paraburkholderia bonniea]WJF94409.1 hypothetical protein QS308_05480 [Paraburkholderia bonniea]